MRVYIPFLTIAILLAGCGGESGDTDDSTLSHDQQLVRNASEQMVNRFSRDLKGELMAAMNEGGPARAIEVCRVQAPEIAAAHSNEPAWKIMRVSDQPRNPANQADTVQMEVLSMFADTTDEVEDVYVHWDIPAEGDTTVYVYKAIYTGDLCMNCHGPADRLAEGVPARLAELYPEDAATGYKPGDLRGMFVVSMRWPDARKHASELAGGPAKPQTN